MSANILIVDDEYDIRNRSRLARLIERVFLTQGGKALARRIYLAEGLKLPPEN